MCVTCGCGSTGATYEPFDRVDPKAKEASRGHSHEHGHDHSHAHDHSHGHPHAHSHEKDQNK